MKETKFPKKIFWFSLLIITALSLTGLQCPPNKQSDKEKVTLKWWRVNFDEGENLQPLINSFQQSHPGATVELRTFTFDEYENELVDALSASTAEENKGPDIISIHNDWLPRWQDRLLPMPDSTKDYPHTSFRDYQSALVETVVDDLTSQGKIYAVPLSVDTLALFYNKDIFDSAGISAPPTTWEEFSGDVKKLTQVDEGIILQSGAALGTSSNINRSTDILELLMLQNGTKMIDEAHRQIQFNSSTAREGVSFNPGKNAVTFYTDFANAQKDVYTWNLNQHYSLDAFVAGETAMMFNYSFRQQTVEKKSPNLNYAIAPMPQIDQGSNKINYPNYWAEAVSNKTKHPHQAWQFVESLMDHDSMKTYNQKTARPPARRDLVDELRNDPVLGIFSEQALTARSWWKPDNRQVEIIFAKMIESINLGKNTIDEALSIAEQSASQLIKKED